MGRKTNQARISAVLQMIKEHDGRLRATDIAKELGLHASEVTRLLPAIDAGQEKWLVEDDRGFLGIFKKK